MRDKMASVGEVIRFLETPRSEREKLLQNPAFVQKIGSDIARELAEKYLAETTDTISPYLIKKVVPQVIAEGAEPFLCMRKVLPVIRGNLKIMPIAVTGSAGYAEKVAEIGMSEEKITTLSYTEAVADQYEKRVTITEEAITEASIDLLDLELKKIGAALENTLNKVAIGALLDGAYASNDIDPSTNGLLIKYLVNAIGKVKENSYYPTVGVLHPVAIGQIIALNNLTQYYVYGGREVLEKGVLPMPLLGIKFYETNVESGSSTYYWDGTDSSNHYYGMVLDPNYAGVIYMKKDITVKENVESFEDLRKLRGIMQFGVKVITSKAISRILTGVPTG